MIRLSHVLATVGAGSLLTAILYPVFQPASACGYRPTCLSNVKQAALGLIQYAADSDDRFAPGGAWMTLSYPYVKNWDVYRCPSLPKGVWGYAYDRALSGEQVPEPPSELPMVYDSDRRSKNAADLVSSLPRAGRHLSRDRKAIQNSIAYADGHAKGATP